MYNDDHEIARGYSVGGFAAGDWLHAKLSDPREAMRASERVVCARMRLGALQTHVITRGLRLPDGTPLDLHGRALFHRAGAALTVRHDHLVTLHGRMARDCTGCVVHTEQTGVFTTARQVAAPHERSQKRADVAVEDCGHHGFVARGREVVRRRRERGGRGVARRPHQADPGMAIGDVAVSDPHAPTYLSAASSRPLGCAALRESAKRSRHEADVVRAGGHFVPLVYETYGAMGREAEVWFRGLIAVAHIEPPEWMAGAEAPELEEYDRWARAQLSADWRRRMSVALQRGNARIILGGAARARSGTGVRVYGHMARSDLDVGVGD